jgi:hypothetical protein
MNHQENGRYVFECDGGCGAVNRTDLKSFQQAVNVSTRADGWDHRRRDGRNWENYCPNCAEYAEPAEELAGIYIGRKYSDD